MSTNHTTNYDLCQWEATDQVLRTDFNQDNAKIDAALNTLSGQVAGKAESSTVSALSSLLNSEISQRQEENNTLQTSLSLKGNCQIYYRSYEGDGTGSEDAPFTMTFPHKPLLVVVGEEGGSIAITVRGAEVAYWRAVGASLMEVSWGDKSLSWWNSDSVPLINRQGNTYSLVALLDMQD